MPANSWSRVVCAALLLLTGCTGDAEGQAAPTSAAPAGPIDESGLVRTQLGLNDPSRVTDPTPDTPGDDATPGRDLTAAVVYPDVPGPLPVVVFSHGLGGGPKSYEELLSAWALAGFFVVAPRYPLTGSGTPKVFDDVVNQPADVSYVLDAIFELNETDGEPFEGLLDPERVAAAGHSAGAMTTLGLLNRCCTDDRIDAAVVLAGSPLIFGGQIAAADVPTLFVHGTDDGALPLSEARAVFEADPGPAAFLRLDGATHARPYDDASDAHYPAVEEATTDFLRWALTDDDAALIDLRSISSRRPDAVLTGDRLPQ
jgi:predicted dienelactone hydrolase